MEVDTGAPTFTKDRREWLLATRSFSWSDYVTVVLMESSHVTSAAIHNARSGALWAGAPNFRLSAKEVRAIEEGFENDENVRKNGIVLNGRHFTLCRVSEQRIMVGRDATSGNGCVIFRCRQCLVAAVYGENNHPGGCYNTVVQLGDFLLDSGL